MMADVLAKEAAFFSIGTTTDRLHNAVDRGNSKVAYLLFSLQSGSASRNQAYHRVR
mgnify:CR=1 FL=1